MFDGMVVDLGGMALFEEEDDDVFVAWEVIFLVILQPHISQ